MRSFFLRNCDVSVGRKVSSVLSQDKEVLFSLKDIPEYEIEVEYLIVVDNGENFRRDCVEK